MNNCYFFVPALKLKSLHNIVNKNKLKMIVVDVEDSIHLSEKESALDEIDKFDFSFLLELGIKIGLRINCINTYSGLKDIQFIKKMDEKNNQIFDSIFIPKINSDDDLKIYRDLFQKLGRIPKITSIIETISAVNNVDKIAASSDALCFGKADLIALMYKPNEAYINMAQASICIAAANNHILAIGTNSFEIQNMKLFEQDCLSLKNAGFTGMAAIHPTQIDIINKIFSISHEEITKVNSFIESYAQNSEFRIIDDVTFAPPFLLKAKFMLNLYEKMKS